MKLQGSVEALVRIERDVLADDLKSGKALLEQEVYGTLHGVPGITKIQIELVHVETNPHGEDLQAERERDEERQFLPSTRESKTPTRDDDVRTVARFITGWWPGLEDGINWPTPEDPNEHPIYAAAKRLQGR